MYKSVTLLYNQNIKSFSERNMKKVKRIISLCLVFVLLAASFASCSSSTVVMEYEGHKITGNMYQYWLSRYKALYLYSYAGGSDSDSFWETKLSDTVTAKDLFTNITDENIKKNLICMYLFDEYSLTLPEESKKEIKDKVEQLVEDMGGKKEFNSYAADFGVNAKQLEEIYLIEEKIEYLRDYLYGANGAEKVTIEQKNKYYEDNYSRIRHIFFSTSTQYVYDENGNYTYDADGNKVTVTPTDEEINKKKVTATAVHARIEAGEDFEKMLEEYTEDEASKTYKNGYYLTSTADYIDEVVEAAFDMEIGEVRLVNSKYGVHIVKRYALDDKGYENEENKDFFGDFDDLVISEVFQNKLAGYLNDVKVNVEEKEKYSIVTAKANLQF